MRLLGEAADGTGYLLKDRMADLEDFADAIRRVARGGSVVDPTVVSELVRRPASDERLVELTEREREVLALMAEGRSNQAIADRLFVTPKTVEAHIASIFSKLELLPAAEDHRRVLAVLAFLEARPG
jgi:DNA-binding NarL/FixJ family response regulator